MNGEKPNFQISAKSYVLERALQAEAVVCKRTGQKAEGECAEEESGWLCV